MKSCQLLLILAIISILSSCSIEKRLYTKGWNVQMHKKYSSKGNENIMDSVAVAEQANEAYDRPCGVKDDKRTEAIYTIEPQSTSNLSMVLSKKIIESEIKTLKEIPLRDIKSIKKVVRPYVEEKLGSRDDTSDYQPWLSILIAGGIVLLVGLLIVLFNLNSEASAEQVILQIFALFFGFIILGIGVILLLIGLIGVMVVNFR